MELWYTSFPQHLGPDTFRAHLSQLPAAWQRKVLSRQRLAARLGALFGARLLQRALQCRPYRLDEVAHTRDGRPFLPGVALDFNVSHAGQYAVCALSYEGRVGVDLEHHTRRHLTGLAMHFGVEEWAALHAQGDPVAAFYRLWTQKEAVAKADGRGLNLRLGDIQVRGDVAELAGSRWHLREVALAPGYTLHLASAQPEPLMVLRRVRFEPETAPLIRLRAAHHLSEPLYC